jgi:Fe-Mn family superoxide dismutase
MSIQLNQRDDMMTRRDALTRTAVITAGLSAGAVNGLAQPAASDGPFKLPELPYPHDALEPHVDAKTMEVHHGRHHAAYVSNLNKALAGQGDLAKKPIEEIIRNLSSVPESIRTAVRNNGGGHYNHSLFWKMMKRAGGGEPKGELAKAIDQTFGGYAGFQERFTDAATKVFGSGWAWLTIAGKKLQIESMPNQDSPLTQGREPLLGLDVWEHAYYLKYQNRRPEYIKAWYNVVNWDFVAERYKRLIG